MKRIREFLESIAYTGLKPGGPAATAKKDLKPGTLRGLVERFLAGGQPTDPLYLSNRTTAEKVKAWSLIGVPCLILAGAIGAALYVLEPREPKPVAPPTPAEITAKILPNVAKDIKVAPSSDLKLVEISVSNSRIRGVVQNTGTREISSADLVLDLTNSTGSQVGAVSVTVENIPAASRRDFSMGIKQHDAVYALVREITTR